MENETNISLDNDNTEENDIQEDGSEDKSANISTVSSDSSVKEKSNNIINDLREWAFQFPPIPHSLRWSIKYITIHFTSITKIFLQTTRKL